MRGVSGIPELRLTVLNKLIERFVTPPNLILMNMFGEDDWESDNIEWESKIGNRGLTPFVSPDAPAPSVGMEGIGLNQAHAAFWKEKQWFNETFLNNLREPGTPQTHQRAERLLAREMQKLKNRCNRRKEWMIAKMLSAGSFDYKSISGVKLSVDYAIPAANKVTLAASRKWSDGASRNIVEDIMDAQIYLQNEISTKATVAFFTSEVLKHMVLDPSIQTLLQKSAFGNGNLFSNPTGVLGALLNIPNLYQYDEQYQVRAWLTAVVTATSTTTVTVDDSSDFEAAGTLRFNDTSAKTSEDETISSVDEQAGTITVATAPATSYKIREDYVTMTKKFLPSDKFVMVCPMVEGEKIAEFARAPFGLKRNYGLYVDQEETWDPDGVYIRVQNKGLPLLYQEDALYILDVA